MSESHRWLNFRDVIGVQGYFGFFLPYYFTVSFSYITKHLTQNIEILEKTSLFPAGQ